MDSVYTIVLLWSIILDIFTYRRVLVTTGRSLSHLLLGTNAIRVLVSGRLVSQEEGQGAHDQCGRQQDLSISIFET
jgi:hypothetical protein